MCSNPSTRRILDRQKRIVHIYARLSSQYNFLHVKVYRVSSSIISRFSSSSCPLQHLYNRVLSDCSSSWSQRERGQQQPWDFLELLELRSTDNDLIRRNMDKLKFTDHKIQNELILLLQQQMLRTITDKIRKAQYFSVMIDETRAGIVSRQIH